MNLFAGFHDISFWQLIPVAAVALLRQSSVAYPAMGLAR